MLDMEKVIKGLECCIVRKHPCGDCVYFVANPNDEDTGWCDRDKIIRNAIELLKAQEPVDPAIGGNQNSCWYFICPRCQLAIDKGDQYCRHCGRAVKWNG